MSCKSVIMSHICVSWCRALLNSLSDSNAREAGLDSSGSVMVIYEQNVVYEVGLDDTKEVEVGKRLL